MKTAQIIKTESFSIGDVQTSKVLTDRNGIKHVIAFGYVIDMSAFTLLDPAWTHEYDLGCYWSNGKYITEHGDIFTANATIKLDGYEFILNIEDNTCTIACYMQY